MSKFCMSYSCGKDSTLALYKMIKAGHTPVGIIVSMSSEEERSWFHGVPKNILNKVSESMGIPLIPALSNGKNYREVFMEAMTKCKELGAEVCVFGDIDIEDHRTWCMDVCNEVGLTCEHPLWQRSRLDITNEFIDLGFKAVIKAVSKKYNLSQDFLGKTLDKNVVEDFINIGIDPCGENGEYHTFVYDGDYDGEIFTFPINFEKDGIHESEYAFSLIIK